MGRKPKAPDPRSTPPVGDLLERAEQDRIKAEIGRRQMAKAHRLQEQMAPLMAKAAKRSWNYRARRLIDLERRNVERISRLLDALEKDLEDL